MLHSQTTFPNNHTWLIERMNILGYQADRDGVCLGIASMALQAILLQDVDSFNKRLTKIFNSPILQFGYDNHSNPDMLAFFDGIQVYQETARYPSLFFQPSNQQDFNAASDLLLPDNLKKAGGIKRLPICYSLLSIDNDCSYFLGRIIQAAFDGKARHPVAIIIKAKNHAITIGYNPNNQSWVFCDANQLPAKKIKNITELKHRLSIAFDAFSGVTMTNIDIYCAKDHLHDLEPCITAWHKYEHPKQYRPDLPQIN